MVPDAAGKEMRAIPFLVYVSDLSEWQAGLQAHIVYARRISLKFTLDCDPPVVTDLVIIEPSVGDCLSSIV
jgi:hypothetical protein